MQTLAEQLRDAIAAYRRHFDAGDTARAAVALSRMQAIHDAIKRAAQAQPAGARR